MPGLVDIIALRETIDLRGVKITVRGLSINTIGKCLAESEELQKFWAQRRFDAAQLLEDLPRTVARIVATSIIDEVPPPASGFADDGLPIDPIAEVALADAAARREQAVAMNMIAFEELIADDQLTLVEAVIRVSFPGGLSPFGARLRALAGLQPGFGQSLIDRFGKVQAGTLPQPSTN